MSSAAQDGDWFPQRIIWTSSWLKELNFSIGKTLLNPSTSQRHQKHKKTKHTTQFLRHDDRRPNQNPEAVGQWPPSPHIHTYTKLQRTAPHPNTHTKETDAQQHKREQKSFWSLQSTALQSDLTSWVTKQPRLCSCFQVNYSAIHPHRALSLTSIHKWRNEREGQKLPSSRSERRYNIA